MKNHNYDRYPSSGLVLWKGHYGSSYAQAISEWVQESKEPMLILATDEAHAKRIQNEVRFFAHNERVEYLPDLETLPYDQESPSSALVSERGKVLSGILSGEPANVIVTTVPALMRRMVGATHWHDSTISLKIGDVFEYSSCKALLEGLGYDETLFVEDFGQFSQRNGKFDIYPIGSDVAYRIELSPEKVIESIRLLNASTQRSFDSDLTMISCMPLHEFPFNEDARTEFRVNWRKSFPIDGSTRHQLYKSVSKGNLPAGIEYFLPLFSQDIVSVFDLISSTSPILLVGEVEECIQRHIEQYNARYEEISRIQKGFVLPPSRLWLSSEDIAREFESRLLISMDLELAEYADEVTHYAIRPNNIKRCPTIADTVEMLAPWFDITSNILVVAESDVRISTIERLLRYMKKEYSIRSSWDDYVQEKGVGIIKAPIERGFYDSAADILVIAEKELYGLVIFERNEMDENLARKSAERRYLADLKVGDPIVHLENGVGRFGGFEKLSMKGVGNLDRIRIEYDENSSDLVSPQDMDMLTRYGGIEKDKAPFDKIKSKKWIKSLLQAELGVAALAKGLKVLHTEREENAVGVPCESPGFSFTRFCNEFPYQMTLDQKRAIDDVVKDLVSPIAMDRLVSGDVGFGKTEVACRAAFVAAQTGYQVAVMVPTTILAHQHYETFIRRFESTGMNVGLLSGKGAAAQQEKEVLNGLKNGEIDIVIGTTRLLQKDVDIVALGLVITDEEHRFGVKDKERLSRFSKGLNHLSMTATPIPRSLSQSMHNIKELSVIATPPAKRLSIRTYVNSHDSSTVAEAVKRELSRGGQVYVVHNRVSSIETRMKQIQHQFPDARVAFAHGQMREGEMEDVVMRFYAHEIDILVATTIIEIGIDVPNANTMIVDDADKMGLAQLHQLRGRVGRSHHQAYCYLLRSKRVSEDGELRLIAMSETTGLGQGLELARYDMEIRGAGQILGESQSGHISGIGFELYMRLLQREIEKLDSGVDNGRKYSEDRCQVLTDLSASIPDTYISDIGARLSGYYQIINAGNDDEIEEILSEFADIYGKVPESVRCLSALSSYRRKLHACGVSKVYIKDTVTTVVFFKGQEEGKSQWLAEYLDKHTNASAHAMSDVQVQALYLTSTFRELQFMLDNILRGLQSFQESSVKKDMLAIA